VYYISDSELPLQLGPAVLTLSYGNYVFVPQKDCVILGTFVDTTQVLKLCNVKECNDRVLRTEKRVMVMVVIDRYTCVFLQHLSQSTEDSRLNFSRGPDP